MGPATNGLWQRHDSLRRARDWQNAGAWQKIYEVLLAKLQEAHQIDWSRAAIDSGSIRAVGGGEKTGPNPTDRAKKGSKHHIITDATGLELGSNAQNVYHDNMCLEQPFGGSKSLANDWEEFKVNKNQVFEYEINTALHSYAESYGADYLRIPSGLSFFETTRLVAHEASHFTWPKYLQNYEKLGWRTSKARWHDYAGDLKSEKGGLRQLLEWNSSLPRGRNSIGTDVWDPFYARDRIYYNEVGYNR
jgi:hypothetical protein